MQCVSFLMPFLCRWFAVPSGEAQNAFKQLLWGGRMTKEGLKKKNQKNQTNHNKAVWGRAAQVPERSGVCRTESQSAGPPHLFQRKGQSEEEQTVPSPGDK